MSEALHSFQSQLSGVMETVFKAAMFEITRLVEDSFVKEVSRSREQVEALKKRLQWSECRRKNQEMRVLRCAECGDKARVCDSEREELLPQSGLFIAPRCYSLQCSTKKKYDFIIRWNIIYLIRTEQEFIVKCF